MADLQQCEFFLLRYVPDAVKNEFVNIGLLLLESGANGEGFADVRFTRDWRRVRCLDPDADVETLVALESEIRDQLGAAGEREALLRRMHESLSGGIQLSAGTACLAASPRQELEKLVQLYLEPAPRAREQGASARQTVFHRLRDAFVEAGVWNLMRKRIAVAQYTHPGDPLKLDCGYRPNGVVKLFHAVSLESDVDAAKVLAFSFPQIAEGMSRLENAKPELTVVVEDDLDRNDEAVAFALHTLERSRITVAAAAQAPQLAQTARRELRV